MTRLFVEAHLTPGGVIAVDTGQAHYLTRVMRLGAGDAVSLFNGVDGEWRARLQPAGKRNWSLVLEALERPQSMGADLDLLIALVKRTRLETIVEKATELDVRRIRLLVTDRTNADHTNLDRLAAIAREAAEQCERLDVPQVLGPSRLAAVLTDWDAARQLVFCDEQGDAPGMCAALPDQPPRPAAILIGPEGGFSPAERAAVRACPAATPVSLGPRILKADTAAIAALALWQSTRGAWRGA